MLLSSTRAFLLLFVLLTHLTVTAQFTDISEVLGELPSVPTSYNGNGVSFADINGDGWDDLSFGRGTNDPVFFVNNEGVFEPATFSIPNASGGQIHMLLWADYDNDGDMDLLITLNPGKIELWQNDGNFNFVNVSVEAGLDSPILNYSGAAFCDFDHDGDLDLYVSKFYHPNIGISDDRQGVFFRNNGNGTFSEVTNQIGLTLGQRPVFQPVFLDYDGDGWEDLYLITDRVFVENALFKNNGDGTFTNVTIESGAGIMICSMSGTVGDYDNDGDLDIFITNSPTVGSKLLRNNGNGTFDDATEELGVGIHEIGWGGLWLDYDNDTYQDLFASLTTNVLPSFSGNRFYRNNNGTVFTDVSDDLGINDEIVQSYVCAMADFNHDGYYDFFLNNKLGYTPTLFENNGGNNNYLSVSLQGTISNNQGIGSWIKCYAGGQSYVRFKLCGENLIGQNGDRLIFGLKTNEVVDSLVVEWNRGTRDVFYNLEVNQNIHVIEGLSQYHAMYVVSSGEGNLICEGQEIVLEVGEFETYLWSDGSTLDHLVVTEPGVYSVAVLTPYGIIFNFPETEIVAAEESLISPLVNHQQCAGLSDASIELTIDGAPMLSIQWSEPDVSGLLADNLTPGIYHIAATNVFGCTYSHEIHVFEADPITTLSFTENVSCFDASDGHAMVLAFGGAPPYAYDWLGLDPENLPAGDHLMIVSDNNGCSEALAFTVLSPDAVDVNVSVVHATENSLGSAAIQIYGGSAPYSVLWSNSVNDQFFVSDLTAGWHFVQVIDANGCEWQQEFEIMQLTAVDERGIQTCNFYPNPVNTVLSVQNCMLQNAQISIFNTSGQLIKVFVGQDISQLDLSSLTAGVYLLTLQSNDGLIRHRFVKQ